jgi:hypothetical protein
MLLSRNFILLVAIHFIRSESLSGYVAQRFQFSPSHGIGRTAHVPGADLFKIELELELRQTDWPWRAFQGEGELWSKGCIENNWAHDFFVSTIDVKWSPCILGQ